VVGLRQEPTLNEVRRMDVVDGDNVHLTKKMNRNAAEYLCNRLVEMKKGEKTACKTERGGLLK
jgi:hypothetical protein